MNWLRWILPVTIVLAAAAAVAGAIAWYGLPPVTFGRPWVLLLLLGLPVLIWHSYKPLRVLGELRCWIVIALRSAVITALILALADIRTYKDDDSQTLLILLDRSYSMPQELQDVQQPEGATRRDVRFDRLAEAIREATRQRPNRRDRIAVITFARRPRLEFPAANLSELDLRNIPEPTDRASTDIAAAIRLALASFPEGSGRRILLISDGNENRGDALKEARTARLNGVPIDVVPIKYQYDNEVVAERIDVPKEAVENRDLPIRIILRNYSDKRISGTIHLWRLAGDRELRVPLKVTLDPGLNVLSLRWPAELGQPVGSFSYRAVFVPDGLPSDRPDNNEVTAPVIVRGEGRRVLFVVPSRDTEDWKPLLEALQTSRQQTPQGDRKRLQIDVRIPEQIPSENDPRFADLSNYDAIFFFNIPADLVPPEKQEALRKTIRDQGCGFVMIGGPDSFGAGRWQGEPLEEALPLDTSIKTLKVQVKGGLVLIMHASEMAQGNYWQKEIARLAVNKLSPQDEVGILYYGYPGGHIWHVELQPIGLNRSKILRKITEMAPGDMPEFDTPFRMAHKALTDPLKGLGARHIILISDGDHGLLQDRRFLDVLRRDRVTVTTVGITTHGPAAQQALAAISQPVGGRHYPVNDPAELPAIYIKETRVINQSFIYDHQFEPKFTAERADPLREWTKPLPPLHGYVRTQPKESQLVQVLLRSPVPGDELNPILAQWQYGLGRVAAFTSDARGGNTGWARDWLKEPEGVFNEFWSRILDWSLRNVDESGLSLSSRYEGGKVRITLTDNRDKESRAKTPLSSLQVIVSAPGSKESRTVNLSPVGAGVYEAVVEAEGSGSYTATVSGMLEGDGSKGRPLILARDAFTVPYSTEFSAVKSNEGLLAEIARESGGRVLDENTLAQADLFPQDRPPARDMRPIWYWLVLLAAFLLLADVAVRRISVDPEAVWDRLKYLYNRMRGRATLPAESVEYIERLKSRKAEVAARLEQPKELAARRFEAPEQPAPPVSAPPGKGPEGEGIEKEKPPPKAPAKPSLSAEAPSEPEDFATRLMRAKRKAREQIEGDKGSESKEK
ncbi:MAG: VWA domain-containing protein [Gemmatales bacterium]|nr:VWA domain-containing protein [Gemmatales bacterium]MDW8387154.1 VWA domain-containing protein [Gemmatales bacterium]